MSQEKERDSSGESKGLLAVIKVGSEEGVAGQGADERDETSHGV